jgi:ribosome maturation factor RimP
LALVFSAADFIGSPLQRVCTRVFSAAWRSSAFCYLLEGIRTLMSWSQAVDRTVTGLGYELVDVERSAGGLLRVLIDRVPGRAYPTGPHEFVTVEDCEAVTRQLQYVLEVENVDYARLEVSSPGLDRPLKLAGHYRRFIGEQVQITLKLPFQGRKKYEGLLQKAAEAEPAAPPVDEQQVATDDAGWQLVFSDGKVDQVLDFNLDEVREARLVPVLDFKGRRGKATPAVPQKADGDSNDGGQQE